jgi:hypothetical protein
MAELLKRSAKNVTHGGLLVAGQFEFPELTESGLAAYGKIARSRDVGLLQESRRFWNNHPA